jgi:dipeptidyl aminopeptidase/acylaminoacyl peptidase
MRIKLLKCFNLIAICSLIFTLNSSIVSAQGKRALEIDDLFRIRRVSDIQISPDGKWIAFVITDVEKEKNAMNMDIYLIPATGGEPRRLTTNPARDVHPRWSPDSKTIAFESNRSGESQIWLIDVQGGEARQLTNISTEASTPMWSPSGKSLAFVSSVYPEFSDKPYSESNGLNKKKDEEKERSKVKARVMTKLLYRHWNTWVDEKKQHIFVVHLDGTAPRDCTPGNRDAVPTSSTFSAGDDFAFSPDGQEIAFTSPPTENEAWNTNHDIFIATLDGKISQLTFNPAADGYPRYSNDGRYIAYRAQRRPGFEADKWELMLYDRKLKTHISLTEKFDASVGPFLWDAQNATIYFTSEEKSDQQIFSLRMKDKKITKIIEGGMNADVSLSANGKIICYSKHTLSRPVEIFSAFADGKNIKAVSHLNDKLFQNIAMNEPESITYKGAGDTPIQAWLITPPGFSPDKKYPLVFLVHGGPQGAWENGWHYRWNAQIWAAQGYVVLAPNPRGSTGFGQKFVDEISGDWGGKVYQDLMNGVEYAEKLPYVDSKRMAAAGASYGGYMMNWLATHTDKFRTIITHAGVYNFYSMYGTTDEVWFDEWEHGGTPWDAKEEYDKYSPHAYAKNLAKYRTPMLIIHNELDYRVPMTEAMQLFTALQRMGIPSKFVIFPDEGHGVLKPLNSEFWHKTVFDWLKQYIGS